MQFKISAACMLALLVLGGCRPATSSAPPAAGATIYPLLLADCVAQPQVVEGREGIDFSAKYSWRASRPPASKKYFFAVRSADGTTTYKPVKLAETGGVVDQFLEAQADKSRLKGPFDAALVTQRVLADAEVSGEYDEVSTFVRVGEK